MTIAKFINNILLLLTFLAFLAQLVIDFSTESIAVACIVFASTISALLYFRWTKSLETHPLSSFALFGFCVTSQMGAILAQSVSWVPLSFNLRQPLMTFALLAMYQAVAMSAHALYRIITTNADKNADNQGLIRYTFKALGIYSTPTVINIWIMSIIGLFSLLLSYISPVANGLSFLAWTPFLIPIYVQQVGTDYCNPKRNYLLLLVYFVLIALMAIMFNTRGMLLSGVATVLFLFLLIGMRSQKKVTSRMILKSTLIGFLGLILSWPASNMVTAMVMARKDRLKVPITKMVTNTIDNFLDPEKIAEYKKMSAVISSRLSYDENYIENPMVARFVITKFHDNAIYFGGKISDKDSKEVWKVSQDFFWATLPQPWLDVLKIDVDKDEMIFSMGDELYYLAAGVPIGGQKTGSIFGQGWVMFGYLFPLIYFFMCLVLFAVIDIFATRTAAGVAVLSVIGMIHVWPNFLFGITADSLHHLFLNVVRGVVQTVLLYAIVFAIARVLSNMYLKLSSIKTIPNAEIFVQK